MSAASRQVLAPQSGMTKSELNKQFLSLCREAQSEATDWQDIVARAVALSDACLEVGDTLSAQQCLQAAALCCSLHRQTELAIGHIGKALQIGPDPHLDTLLEIFRDDLEYYRRKREQKG
jgi:DNA-binding phage protein